MLQENSGRSVGYNLSPKVIASLRQVLACPMPKTWMAQELHCHIHKLRFVADVFQDFYEKGDCHPFQVARCGSARAGWGCVGLHSGVMAETRAILHVDMDAFFASVEQLDDPALRGRPVLVGHDGPRGVVAAASYESRVLGCRSAQPIGMAKRLCPHAVIVPARFSRYREVSAAVFRLFHAVTPQIEPLSIDEAFLDVTGSLRLLGPPEQIAADLKARIKTETGLTASVGVAPNKFLAKLASDMDKPDGLTVVRPEDVDRLLVPMPVGRIFGIGPKTAERLAGIGVKTIGDLRNVSDEALRQRVGGEADRYRQLAFGLDDRPVVTDDAAKSIGQEQ